MKARTSFSFTIVGIDWMRHGAERKTFASVLHLGKTDADMRSAARSGKGTREQAAGRGRKGKGGALIRHRSLS
jgi:hypothetical protein